ncbi:DUF4153 domain-containing protein [Kitasatospora sp. NPDC054939]
MPASAPQPPGPERAPGAAGAPGPGGAPGAPFADPYRPLGGMAVPQPFAWLRPSAPGERAPAAPRVIGAAALVGLLTAWMLPDGLGVNLLLLALAAAVGAGLAARSAGRRLHPWTATWSLLALALLAVPALYDAGWPTVLSFFCALGLASLAVHGGKRWSGVLLALPGVLWHLVPGLLWARNGLRGAGAPGRGKVVPVLKAVVVAAVLLLVFGALFSSADAAMADVLDSLTPSIEFGELPVRFVLFMLGLATALGFARIAAAPRRWDRTVVKPGRERGRLEWALPLTALNLLFGAFAVVQAVVVLGGGDSIVRSTGMSRSEYARQGFWQLVTITVLTLVVVAVAKRWAPRTTESDRRLATLLVGSLCVLTLTVVASALGRMWYYVDASGLTQLRLWVLVVEIWLGVVFVLLIVAGLLHKAAWLPRTVLLSGMVTAAVYGLMGPDAIIAEQNVARFERTAQIDLRNVRSLSLDAVPALDRLTGDHRTCALELIRFDLDDKPRPWYATSLAESRARDVFRKRPVLEHSASRLSGACMRAGLPSSYNDYRY